METCPTCSAPRRYIGVLYPARRLCSCESRKCHCGKTAIIAEFQAPIRGKEPKLPVKKTSDVSFLCEEDAPGDFPLEEAPPKPKASPAPARAVPPSKDGFTPNLQEGYCGLSPPYGSLSRAKVECWSCKNVHELRQRKEWNGDHSVCPKCGDDTYTQV